MSRVATAVWAVVIAVLVLLGVSACGDKSEMTLSGQVAVDTTTIDLTGPAQVGPKPAWATTQTHPGAWIAAGRVGDLQVDAYQVDVVTASDPAMHRLLAPGERQVIVNFVVTNQGETINVMPGKVVEISPQYAGSPAPTSAPDTPTEVFENRGLVSDGLAGTLTDSATYAFGTGQSLSFAKKFNYRPDTSITFSMTLRTYNGSGAEIDGGTSTGRLNATIR